MSENHYLMSISNESHMTTLQRPFSKPWSWVRAGVFKDYNSAPRGLMVSIATSWQRP